MKKRLSNVMLGFLSLLLLLSGCTNEAAFVSDISTYAGSYVESSIEESTEISTESSFETSEDSFEVYDASEVESVTVETFDISDIPEYSGTAYVIINDNIPYFTDDEITTVSFEEYGDLDSLGRCTVAYACIGFDLMPTEERGDISSIYPTGWVQAQYSSVDGGYLYNRCHMIGYQLTGENANEKNLITGTRYMNVEGMLPFENMVADYIEETDYHVMYRVTPIFIDDNLLASGVLMEAYSVEDDGDGILFCVYCYNVQPGIEIDYATGESYEASSSSQEADSVESSDAETTTTNSTTYILNTNTMKFHYSSCSSVSKMSESNKQEYSGTRDELISQGYEACGNCTP